MRALSPVAALALLLPLLAPSPARAVCANPSAAVLPESGSVLPPSPTLYVFMPGDQNPRVRVESSTGAAVPFELDWLSRTSAYGVWTLTVRQQVAGGIVLTVHDGQPGASWLRYQVDPGWKPASTAGTVDITSWARTVESPGSGSTDALFLRPSVGAPAYRLEWARSEWEYRAGGRTITILPHDPEALWRGGATAPDVRPELGVGHLGCLGETFPREDGILYVGVSALHEDGSVTPAHADPVAISFSAPALGPSRLPPPPPRPAAERHTPRPYLDGASPAVVAVFCGRAYGKALIILAVGIALLVWLTRRPAEPPPPADDDAPPPPPAA
jgi:hypothetical protein